MAHIRVCVTVTVRARGGLEKNGRALEIRGRTSQKAFALGF